MNVFFFGDSICYGQNISPHKTWVTRISQKLAEISQEITVISASISGNTTRMALERIQFDVQSHGVDVILIQFGINDSNFWVSDNGLPRVSEKAFEANLKEIISRVRRFGAKKILINTNHPTDKTIVINNVSVPHQLNNKKYNNIIRNVAEEDSDVLLIDMEKIFYSKMKDGVPLQTLLLADGIHLSVQGHELYLQTISPFIEQAVENVLGIEYQFEGNRK